MLYDFKQRNNSINTYEFIYRSEETESNFTKHLKSQCTINVWEYFKYICLTFIVICIGTLFYLNLSQNMKLQSHNEMTDSFIINLLKKMEDKSQADYDSLIKKIDSNHHLLNSLFKIEPKILEQITELPNSMRFDCYPENGATKQKCEDRGCKWAVSKQKVPLNTPYCYYPEDWRIYKLLNMSYYNKDSVSTLELIGNSPYGKDIKEIQMKTNSIDNNILQVKVFFEK